MFSVIQILLTSQELPIRSVERRFRTKLGVTVTGLEDFLHSTGNDPFKAPQSGLSERDVLLGQKHNIENGLSRLRNLFIHDGIAEKDYLVEQKKLTEKLEKVDSKLSDTTSFDEELNIRATYFVLMDKMAKSQFDYATVAPYAETLPLQRFLRATISSITVKDGFISRICFKNQKTLSFSSNQKTAISQPSGQS